MLATTSGYQQMIGGHTVSGPVARLQITLPSGVTDVSATVTKLSIDASTTSDMPSGTRIAAGYPSMGLSFSLADVAGLFAPYNTGSAMFRLTALKCAVTVDVGTFPPGCNGVAEWLRKFTGSIDSYQCNTDGSVDFTCIDNRNLLRSLPDIAAVVTAPPYNAGLTSEFAIDALLRAATGYTYSSWPAIRSQCVLAVGCRASLWPEVGALVTSTPFVGDQGFSPGVFGSALFNTANTVGDGYSAIYQPIQAVGTVLRIEGWCKVLNPSGSYPTITIGDATQADYVQIGLGAAPGYFTGDLIHAFDNTRSYSSYYFAVVITLPAVGGTTWRFDSQINGATFTSGSLTRSTGRNAAVWQTVTVGPGTTATIEALQITTEAALAPANNAFVPQAVLDQSLNTLQVTPALSGDPWQIIQQAADAEAAVAGFDESGIFRFTNRNTLAASPVTRTITSKVSLKALQIAVTGASFANHVTVPYTPWIFAAPNLVYTATAVYQIPKRTSASAPKVWTVTLPDGALVAQVDATASKLPNAHVTTDGNSWFRASADPAGLNEATGVTVTINQTSSGQIQIIATNSSGVDAWLISPANYIDIAVGTPSLWVGGIAVSQADAINVDQSVDTADTAISISPNSWLQDDATATQLAFDLLDDLYYARPDLTGIDVVPDPAIQLMDRVRVTDTDRTGVDEYAIVWGWTLTLAKQAWAMTVDARTIAAPGQWILDDDVRSILDSTTYI